MVQDVFVKMLGTEAQIPADKLRAWMYRVSIRRYIDRYRRDKRYLEILRRDFFRQEELEFFDMEDYDWLYQAMEDLPDREAIFWDLYYFQRFTVKEIANTQRKSKSKLGREPQAVLEYGKAKLTKFEFDFQRVSDPVLFGEQSQGAAHA